MAGKGSKQRPGSVNRQTFSDNWDRIFHKPNDPVQITEPVSDYDKMFEFIRYIATDYIELSHEKVRIQRDDYVRMAREIMKSLDVE